MASKFENKPDNVGDILYVKRKKKDKLVYGGYKREYLARNLSEIEEDFVICKICVGITRNASLYKEETTCFVCSESPNLHHVKLVQTAVNQLKIKCPLLRRCNWSGKLSEAEGHLKNCGTFLIQCDLCKEVFSRSERELHETEQCPLRIIKCDYCYQDKQAKCLSQHFEVCSGYPISCPNECGAEFPREELSEHMSECELEVVICPYKEYGCKAESVLRRDILTHKKEFYIEHLDMSLVEIKQLKDENVRLKEEQNVMKCRGMSMKQLDGIEWKIKLPIGSCYDTDIIGPTFFVNNYKLTIYCKYKGYYSYFYLRRIKGEFDKNLGLAYITHYRVVYVINKRIDKCEYQEGIMNYPLKSWTWSERIQCSYLRNECLLIFYFDVNSNHCEQILSTLK